MAKNQLIGGNFQDLEGNVLANGYLTLELTGDEQIITNAGQVCSGLVVKIALDSTGNVPASPVVAVWPNDQLNPTGSQYIVNAYSANGQLVWGPQYLTVPSSPSPYSLDNWVPSSNGTSGGSSGLLLETNGVANGSQNQLNLKNGANIAITDDGVGGVTVAATGIPPTITLKHNGTNNASQSILNLVNGTNTTVVDNGGGSVQLNVPTVAGITLETNGTPNSSQTLLNLANGTDISITEAAGVVTVASVPTALGKGTVIGGKGVWPVNPTWGSANVTWTNTDWPVSLIILDRPFTFTKASIYAVGGASATDITGAIYDYGLTTRLVYLGNNAIHVPISTSGPFTANVTPGPVTLPAGAYWQVVAATTNNSFAPTIGMNSAAASVLNAGSVKMGSVTNPGGVYTATISGAISGLTGLNNRDIVSFIWE